jgi:hypothetical protein
MNTHIKHAHIERSCSYDQTVLGVGYIHTYMHTYTHAHKHMHRCCDNNPRISELFFACIHTCTHAHAQTLRQQSKNFSTVLCVSEAELQGWIDWAKGLQCDVLAFNREYTEHEMMQVCMHVCMYVCYVCMYVCMYVYIYIYVCMYTHTVTHTDTYVDTHTHKHTHTHAHILTDIRQRCPCSRYNTFSWA